MINSNVRVSAATISAILLVIAADFSARQSAVLILMAVLLIILSRDVYAVAIPAAEARPYLITLLPKWEAIHAEHSFGVDADVHAWLSNAYARGAADAEFRRDADRASIPEQDIIRLGIRAEWLNEKHFRIEHYRTASSSFAWRAFLSIKRAEPSNTLILASRWTPEGYEITVAPERLRTWVGHHYVGGVPLALLPHALLRRVRSGQDLYGRRFVARLQSLGWRVDRRDDNDLETVIRLDHRFFSLSLSML